MRRDVVIFSILLFSAVNFLDAYNLPLDFNPTDEDLRSVNLLSNEQNKALPCSAGKSNSNTVSKRQTTNCVGVDCGDNGTNDNVAPESPTTDNQPLRLDDLTHNPEGSLELAINLNSGSQDNLFSDGNKDWNNAVPNFPLNDATTNILSSAPNGPNTLDQAGTDVFDDVTDGALSDAFEIAAKPKPALIVDQDPTTGEPIETSCLVPPEDQPNAYLVRLIAFQAASVYTPWRSAQAILVTQYRTGLRYKYDIHVLPSTERIRYLGYRKVINYSFLSKGKIIPLSRYEPRGWLISWPENVALEWFENLAQSVRPPKYGTANTPGPHVTAIWVARVFEALAASNAQYWIPITV